MSGLRAFWCDEKLAVLMLDFVDAKGFQCEPELMTKRCQHKRGARLYLARSVWDRC